jgi:hypothetical protein
MLGAAGLVIGAGMAHADSGPDIAGYYNALENDGLITGPTASSLRVGTMVCRDLRLGETDGQIIDYLVNPPNPIPRFFATDVVVDAHMYLCPDATGSLAGYVTRHHK